jgi:hypothetical protein
MGITIRCAGGLLDTSRESAPCSGGRDARLSRCSASCSRASTPPSPGPLRIAVQIFQPASSFSTLGWLPPMPETVNPNNPKIRAKVMPCSKLNQGDDFSRLNRPVVCTTGLADFRTGKCSMKALLSGNCLRAEISPPRNPCSNSAAARVPSRPSSGRLCLRIVVMSALMSARAVGGLRHDQTQRWVA